MGLGLGDVLLVLFFLVYLYWLATPRLEDPELVAECLEEARVAHEASQRYAHDPEMNGYLSPTFYPFWGQFPLVKDREEAPVETKVREWAKYSSNWSDEVDWDLESLQTDPEYLELKEWFEGLAEELYRELDKPCFVVPGEVSGRETSVSTSVFFLGAGLRALAEAYLALGRVAEAFEAIYLSLRLTVRLQDSQVSPLDSLGDGPFAWVLRDLNVFVRVGWSDADHWERITTLCLPALSPRECLSLRLRRRLAFQQFELSKGIRYASHERPNWLQRGYDVLTTVLARARGTTGKDIRYFCNGHTKLIRNWDRGIVEELPRAIPWVFGDWVVPRGQYLENIFSLGLRSASSRLGLGVSAPLLAHRLNHGNFPTDLRVLPHEVDPKLFEWNPQTGELLVLIPPNLPAGVWKPRPEPENWIEATTRGLLFRLNPI